eukprot:206027_1
MIDFLPRFTIAKNVDVRLRNGGKPRVVSPRGGGSTLSTFAPKSHKICVANGPDSATVKSTTVTPSRGPLERVCPGPDRRNQQYPGSRSNTYNGESRLAKAIDH